MTWRAVWDVPGTPFPAHVDHTTEAAAHLFALRKSREVGGEVAVIPIPGPESPAERLESAERGSGTSETAKGRESGKGER